MSATDRNPSLVREAFAEHLAVVTAAASLEKQIEEASELVISTLQNGGKVLWAGNGGSASDAQHLSAELIGRFVDDRRPLASIALTTDTSALTAISNDYGFEEVFARQVRGLGRPEDLFVGISTSGNSPNVLRAAMAARSLGMATLGLSGRKGGELATAVDLCLTVPSEVTARIQEVHILIGHIFCARVDEAFRNSNHV